MSNGKRGPQEWATFIDKILVFYTNERNGNLQWSVVPKEEIYRIDPDRYLFYVHWSFDAYFHFLGRRIEDRLISILDSAINCTALSSIRYSLNAFERQRKAAVRAVRRRALRMMKRYYNGSFLTKRFRDMLRRFIDAISSNVSLSLQQHLDYPFAVAGEYAN